MIIEGLLGHPHEDVIGAMRGDVRAPEPRGKGQETPHPLTNLFPEADIVRPPLAHRPLRFHQVKSKTGSAKGGDGRRSGLRLSFLSDHYGGEAFSTHQSAITFANIISWNVCFGPHLESWCLLGRRRFGN